MTRTRITRRGREVLELAFWGLAISAAWVVILAAWFLY